MTCKPSAVRIWAIATALVSLPIPVKSDDGTPQTPYRYKTSEMTNVGGPFTAYRSGIGHTEASPTYRRPLDGTYRSAPPPSAATHSTPVVDWSGTYIGASIGGLISSAELDGALDDDLDTSSYDLSAHVGTNAQVGRVIFGGEIDAVSTDAAEQSEVGGGITTKTSIDWLASARLRAGVAVDNVLLYGTGGIAVTSSETEINALGFRAASQELHTGYVVGAGAEMAIVDGVNARIEALHYGFSGETIPTPTGSSDLDLDVTTVRAGVSFKFK